MKIRKMTATFGGLHHAVLSPGEGLTVITAPNETGKSTWAAFLKAMFYGVDTKERDKVGYLADKNRYQPWDGAPMQGEIRLDWEGRDITIRRTSNRSGPMQQFEALYTASGDPVPGLTGANVGQTLLGVGKDVFVRSALVGQNSTAVTAAPELERRIAALATSGEEDVSASATQRTLKDWRNRRRSNRANGLIPELEDALRSTKGTLAELDSARLRRDEAASRLAALEEEKKDLKFELELHRRQAAKALNRRTAEAQMQLAEAEEQLSALPAPDPVFAGMTREQAKALEASRREQADALRQKAEQADAYAALSRRRHDRQALAKVLIPVLGVLGLVLTAGGILSHLFALSAMGILCLIAAAAAAVILPRQVRALDGQMDAILRARESFVPPEIPDADGYLTYLSRREALEQEVRHCRERFEDLLAQGGHIYDTLELLPNPKRPLRETEQALAEVEAERLRWQSVLDRAIGSLNADPLELEVRAGELADQLARRSEEYDALDIALTVLDEANAALRERFSPALNREAAAIFSRLTGGKYHTLTLSRDFSATAGDDDPHSSLYLSAGAVDQLYLSVRLALCRLTAPDAPILLDDALCTFDDHRMALALEALKDMGRERQILLFSCHEREAAWAKAHGVDTIRL